MKRSVADRFINIVRFDLRFCHFRNLVHQRAYKYVLCGGDYRKKAQKDKYRKTDFHGSSGKIVKRRVENGLNVFSINTINTDKG